MTVSPPSAGIRTFLFSDIEGSTRLEQQVGTERYAALLERHRAILRAAWDVLTAQKESEPPR